MKIAMLAGEASGDLLGARLIKDLKEHFPDLKVEGIGGPAMQAAGCHNLFNIERLSVMGFIEPIMRLPDLIRLRRDIYHHLIKHRPDVFIGIDSPDFNLGLEQKLRKTGIPVIHYVSPSVWAWRQYRVKKISKAVDLMLTLLPFEKKFYEQFNIPARYVGHPLAEQIPLNPDKYVARRALHIDEDPTYIALLPGSRRQELNYMSETYLLAAKALFKQKPNLKFLTSHVNERRYQEFFETYKRVAPELPIEFFTHRSQDVIAASDIVIVTSGTATLETMLFKKPMIIAYKMSPFTYQIAKRLVKSNYVGLPNLLANDAVVPELIQAEATPKTICNHVINYLDHPDKAKKLTHTFTQIHQNMQAEAQRELAELVRSVLR